MRSSSAAGTTVASRLISVLECFDGFRRTATLTEIARDAGLTLPTAYRLVKELTAAGLLRRGEGGSYSVGLKLWELGCAAPGPARLQEMAMPYLQDLYEATRENVHLAVKDGNDVLYIAKLSGPSSIALTTRIGRHLPWHTTGVGKAIVAHEAEGERARLLSRPLERWTPKTITEPGRMAAELRRVRDEGYALSQEEHELGTFSIAAPVLDRERQPLAAVAVTLPSARANVPRLVTAVRTVAIGIGRALAN